MKPLKRLFIVSWCILCFSTGSFGSTVRGSSLLEGLDTTGGPIESTLTIAPTLPTVDAPIQVTMAGIWSDACIPTYKSHIITGQTIVITLEPLAPVCGQVVTPWSITVALGHLSAATYQLQVTGVVTMSTTMTVFGNFSYLPLVSGH